MTFNPFTDLVVEQNNESIEDVPKVNIELELLPVLRKTTLKTKQVAETIKSGNRLLRNDLIPFVIISLPGNNNAEVAKIAWKYRFPKIGKFI